MQYVITEILNYIVSHPKQVQWEQSMEKYKYAITIQNFKSIS